jgi:hypothetical protein
MSLLTLAVVAATHLPAAVTPPVPADLFATFGESALGVLAWVIAGILAAAAAVFALIGIRKGLGWFFSMLRKG